MNINAESIEQLGGLTTLEMELNTPELPEVDEKTVTTYLFDGYGVFSCNDSYYTISYQQLDKVWGNEQVRRHINMHRYGNRLPNDFEVTIDDLAICFGEVESCEYSEYVSYIIDGLIENATRMLVEDGVREVLSVNDYSQKLREIEKTPPKHLYLLKDLNDLGEQFDGEIYSVSDEMGEHICDVLQEDLIDLEKQGIINNQGILTSEEHRAKLLSTRFEAIIFLKTK